MASVGNRALNGASKGANDLAATNKASQNSDEVGMFAKFMKKAEETAQAAL